ncbi:hypothetical protein G7048_19100 [Diaphorobacter sp. HDW4B]|uniref:hypothetical protein n=1 Tax=Diaphorobacter sp. HDW4B TaxID=2714925 RepID=UPI0014085798|nr:hypothetical protein [Diaphorobacter sp. HDW4B]QIL72274.1 hypothetical protein G7048_19100 [Diaphorobacter sp. HDW4B]
MTQTQPIPLHPIALRREYLEASRLVANGRPDEADVARLVGLTQALLRDLVGEPKLDLVVKVPASSLKAPA